MKNQNKRHSPAYKTVMRNNSYFVPVSADDDVQIYTQIGRAHV